MKLLPVFLTCILLCSCSADIKTTHKQDSVSIEKKSFDLGEISEVFIENDYGSIEIHKWTNNEIKFENTKKVRGVLDQKALDEKLKLFRSGFSNNDKKLSFKSFYDDRAKNPADMNLDIKLYIPAGIRKLDIKLETGKIKAYDDTTCDLNISAGEVNTTIDNIKSRLNLKADMGNLTISNGHIKKGSTVKTNIGNIILRAAFEETGGYSIETSTGYVDINTPAESKIIFDCIGDVDINDKNADYKTRVNVSSGMGKISIKKY